MLFTQNKIFGVFSSIKTNKYFQLKYKFNSSRISIKKPPLIQVFNQKTNNLATLAQLKPRPLIHHRAGETQNFKLCF